MMLGEFWVMNSTSLKVSPSLKFHHMSLTLWSKRGDLKALQILQGSCHIPSQPSLLQAKHLQIFLLGLQAFRHLGSPFLDSLQFITVFLKL